jgi:hypothetical protein
MFSSQRFGYGASPLGAELMKQGKVVDNKQLWRNVTA